MKKIIMSLALISTSAFAQAKEQDCNAVWTGLAKSYLAKNTKLVEAFTLKASPDANSIDTTSLKVCDSYDLEQGSWNLLREVSFCTADGDVLKLFTQGDLYCTDESVVGISEVVFKALKK